jgi:hypothetical protein
LLSLYLISDIFPILIQIMVNLFESPINVLCVTHSLLKWWIGWNLIQVLVICFASPLFIIVNLSNIKYWIKILYFIIVHFLLLVYYFWSHWRGVCYIINNITQCSFSYHISFIIFRIPNFVYKPFQNLAYKHSYQLTKIPIFIYPTHLLSLIIFQFINHLSPKWLILRNPNK